MIEELIIYLHKKHNKISWQEVKKRWFRTNCVESHIWNTATEFLPKGINGIGKQIIISTLRTVQPAVS